LLNRRRVLAVVPARGGSKGLPRKNLRKVGGVPLVARVGNCVREVPCIDRAVVSTDDDEIASVAEGAGLAAPFRRPADLSGDRIGDWDVLAHALTEMERIDGVQYDVVLMLQPTSPLRRPQDVARCAELLVHEGWDAVWTVSGTDLKYHPLKQLAVDDATGQMTLFDERGASIIARQQLKPVYHRNGVAYAMTRQCLLEQRTIRGARTKALVLDDAHVSIDTAEDLAHADAQVAARERSVRP
jgi:CMP-N-acetylneuraminic acid synthetase